MQITKDTILGVLACLLAFGAIAYNEYDNHQWRVEYQAQCDREGC